MTADEQIAVLETFKEDQRTAAAMDSDGGTTSSTSNVDAPPSPPSPPSQYPSTLVMTLQKLVDAVKSNALTDRIGVPVGTKSHHGRNEAGILCLSVCLCIKRYSLLWECMHPTPADLADLSC